jgi:sugar diacid utilization regulator
MPKENKSDNYAIIRLNQFCFSRKNMWCIPCNDGFVILLDARENSMLNSLENIFGEQFGICSSGVFDNLKDMPSHLELCRMALGYSKQDGNDNSVIIVEDYKAIIAYLYAYHHSKLNVFSNDSLKAIREHDEKYRTSYFETLRVCVHYNQNINKISDALHIQKNTAFYRLRQLKELFGIDMKDTRQLVNIYMSLCQEYHSGPNERKQSHDQSQKKAERHNKGRSEDT